MPIRLRRPTWELVSVSVRVMSPDKPTVRFAPPRSEPTWTSEPTVIAEPAAAHARDVNVGTPADQLPGVVHNASPEGARPLQTVVQSDSPAGWITALTALG